MKSPDGSTVPIWYGSSEVPTFRGFSSNSVTEAEVAVIGAGISGLTTAYLALKAGLTVAVFDEGPVGSGQTGRTSAHLASAIDDRFTEIERLYGQDASRLAYESHAAAIDQIERICLDEKIECEFSRLNAFLFLGEGDLPELLDKEFEAAKRAGFADIELLSSGPLKLGKCIRFGNQARFHPLRYLTGLAEAVRRMGGHIYCGQRVIDVQGSDPKTRNPARTKLEGVRKTFESKHIVVATNTPSPINDWFGIYTKQSSYRTYVIAIEVKRGFQDALYWDTLDPYHYVRLEQSKADGKDVLLVGGEDHKTGQFPKDGAPFRKLDDWARSKFPELGEVTYRWSGQVQEPADGLGFIGRALTDKEEVFVVTGDSGMGLTHGTIGAMLINDQIAGKVNPWEKLYDPSRKILNKDFVAENANTVSQYVDLVTPGEVKSEEDVLRGHGAVMRDGLSKICVYRDKSGTVHKCSAVCTHLQCIVQWNHIEESWDCPCHGSRFDPLGKVLIGPAIDDLPPVR